jgi:site-specific DNA-methyltransferase (adenine-specific)
MLQGDCMDFMRDKPDKFWDLAIVDPEFGIGQFWMKSKHTYKFGDKKWNTKIPDRSYFEELFRVSKNQIIWGGNYFTEFLIPTNSWIIWDKERKLDKTFMSEAELAWTSFKIPMRILKVVWDGARKGTETGQTNIHPCQRPVKLHELTLKYYAKPGNKILDTHGGSGSICIACHNLGFDLDWIELDPDYYRDAIKRFENHKAQLRMF